MFLFPALELDNFRIQGILSLKRSKMNHLKLGTLTTYQLLLLLMFLDSLITRDFVLTQSNNIEHFDMNHLKLGSLSTTVHSMIVQQIDFKAFLGGNHPNSQMFRQIISWLVLEIKSQFLHFLTSFLMGSCMSVNSCFSPGPSVF